MPYVIRPPVRKMSWVGALALAAIIALLAPSLARADHSESYTTSSGLGCDPVSVSQPFGIFGDYSDYYLADGGDFESGAPGWTLYGAEVVSGNETYYVGGAGHANSLRVGHWGRAVSNPFCVDARHPHFRFFARSSSDYGLLLVRARWTEGDDSEHVTLGLLGASGYQSWSPTAMLPLADPLRLTDTDRTQHIRLAFTALAGTWRIDDVYVDPYRR